MLNQELSQVKSELYNFMIALAQMNLLLMKHYNFAKKEKLDNLLTKVIIHMEEE